MHNFHLPNVVPKARPRFKGGRAYLPQNYRDWMNDAVSFLLTQSRPAIPINHPVQVSITLKQPRGDLDNLAGAVLDALVNAAILEDDRCSIVRRLIVDVDGTVEGVAITIAPY